MAKTKIYESFEAFLNRPESERDYNGVSLEFAKKYPDYEYMNITNTGCWNCIDCLNCKDCYWCSKCFKCVNCKRCHMSLELNDCEHCAYCVNKSHIKMTNKTQQKVEI